MMRAFGEPEGWAGVTAGHRPSSTEVHARFAVIFRSRSPRSESSFSGRPQDWLSSLLLLNAGEAAPAGRGGPPPFNFASDDKPQKKAAREMMLMVRDINPKVAAAVGKSAEAATRVGCVTCHRGVAIPKQLADILNLEYFPMSARTYAVLSQAQRAENDTAAAIKSLEKAVELDPQNAQLRRQLDQLKGQ
jgi:hypothetical protein